MWLDLIVEYATGFEFGLFIFQSLFMKKMMGGTYWENVRRTFLPEFISMNAMMAGMGSLMSFLMMGRDMRAMDPLELLFWGVMSLGVIAGFTTAYPVNVWMVAKNLKHGLMTERKKGGPFDLRQDQTKDNQPRESHAHNTSGHDAMKPENHSMSSGVTSPQLFAVTAVSLVLLLTGLIAPANWVNLRLSAKQVGGLIMPPG
jgi:manganese oxidase